jgi:hypothetical protein
MKPTGLGRERVKSRDTVCARGGVAEQGASRQTGDRRMLARCPIGPSSRRSSRADHRAKDPTGVRSPHKKFVPDIQDRSTQANLTADHSNGVL